MGRRNEYVIGIWCICLAKASCSQSELQFALCQMNGKVAVFCGMISKSFKEGNEGL
jgi:hypothetical protein